jgi:hypothetical protein
MPPVFSLFNVAVAVACLGSREFSNAMFGYRHKERRDFLLRRNLI